MRRQLVTSFERIVREKPCTETHGLPLNPFRLRVWRESDGTWSANYKRAWQVDGCTSAADATQALRHFVRMKVAYIDGEFVEVR